MQQSVKDYRVVEKGNRRYVEVLGAGNASLDFARECREANIHKALLDFSGSTGEASGDVGSSLKDSIRDLVANRVRVAVIAPNATEGSGPLADVAGEPGVNGKLRIFGTREDAEEWLLGAE